MLAYLVIASRSGEPIDPDLIARFDQGTPVEVPFRPETRIVWKNEDESVVFFGWQTFTGVAGIGSHWAADERGLTAFAGHCWPRARGWDHGTARSWADQLRSWLGDSPDLPAARESLFGQFTLCSIPARGTGWAMPDWASADRFLVSESSEVIAVSNRGGLCARAVAENTTPPRSLVGAGWLISESWMLDQETGFWNVRHPRPGSYLVVESGQGARIVEPPHSPLLPPAPEDPAPDYEDLLDEAARDLRTTIREIAELPVDQRVLQLSGGKDSRTLLGFIFSEGVQDQFRFLTYGSPERADVLAAGAIAQRFGLDWSFVDFTNRSPESELQNVLVHTGLTEGMTSAWGTWVYPHFDPIAMVSGVSGEGLRWGPTPGPDTPLQLDAVVAELLRTCPIDRLGVLHPEPRAYYRQRFTEWIHEQAAEGVPLRSIPKLYRQERTLHNRNGIDHAWSPHLRINPYLTPAALRSNHRLCAERRPDHRFHLDLQRRCSVDLSKMPLTEDTWTPAEYGHLPDAKAYQHIEPVYSTNADGRTWRQKHYGDYLPMIQDVLLDRDNPVHELLDYDRLARWVASGGEHPGRTRLIWGMFTAALWMGNYEPVVELE